MTRLETELLDLAESILRNDDTVHDADYRTLYGIATDVGEVESENTALRKLVRCLVEVTHPADRAQLISNATDVMAELLREEVGA